MISLYIENEYIELDNEVQFAITKTFEDLSNPTLIINDWSKTVAIPFTDKNNKTFGHIYNPDRLTIESEIYTTGLYFNPLKKLNFRLEWDSNVIMTGYAKMLSVTQTNGIGRYNITLNGELGKVFQEMKKITFDTTTDETDYLIHGEEYVEEYINKELVYKSWTSTGQSISELQNKGSWGINIETGDKIFQKNPNYKVTDIIGFVPNNSFSKDFDYKSFQLSNNTSKQFTEVLNNINFTASVGIEPETVIPNGLYPREIGEYRSYLQLPFIYWNKLFQIFQTKAEEVTGYKFELDDTWFNANNPYWNDLVFMLYGFGEREAGKTTNLNQYAIYSSGLAWGKIPNNAIQTNTINIRYSYAKESYPILIPEENTDYSTKFKVSKNYTIRINPFYFRMQIPAYYKQSELYDIHLNPNNAFEFTIELIGSNGLVESLKYLLCDEDYTGNTEGYVKVFRMEGENRNAKHLNGSYEYYDIETPPIPPINYKDYIEYATINYTGRWLNNNYPFQDDNDEDYISTQPNYTQRFYNMDTLNVDVIEGDFRTNSYFTLNDLWNKEYKVFDKILEYCKIFKILITINEFDKKIIFKPFNTYFSDYSVEDWSNKIDLTKEFTITPTSFEDKYILFKYKDNNGDIGKIYKEKYGVNYGAYNIITDYNFNTNTIELFKDITQSITNTDNILSWENLYTYKSLVYSLPPEIYVYNKDKEGKQISIFGAYFFHKGLTEFSTEESLRLRPVYISDDTLFQQSTSKYYYTQVNSDMVRCTSYPLLDVVNGENVCLFNLPKESFKYTNDFNDKYTIYNNFWEDYINERYNIQNKKITCYVKLSPLEYYNFNFNQFVQVGNQLCMVNKIYDYNLTNNEPTKVDLITIQNVNAYTTNNYEINK